MTTFRSHATDRREYDAQGWYEVLDNPLSKAGVYPYRESSIFKGGDPNKIIGVLRPPEELGSQECIDSFKLMPWTDDHPRELLGPKEDGFVPADEKGVRGVTGEQIYFRGDTLYGNIKVFSEALAQKIASGKRELSLGYHCQFVPKEGVFEGQPYQYVQRNIRGNHVASVNRGRMGSDVRVLDEAEHFLTFALDLREESHLLPPAAPAQEFMMTSVSEAARQIRQEEASRTQLYQRLAPIVGAFDAGEMSAAEIAAYGLKKLNLTVPSDDGSKVAAINCWLAGRDLATNPDAGRRGAMDSGGNSIVDRYIRGEA